MVVKSKLEELGLHPIQVELGEVEILENDISILKERIKIELHKLGFELLNDKKTKTIELIKTTIIDLVHEKNNQLSINLSDYLADTVGQEYSMLSNLFSEVEGQTIEKYYILQKVEKVKELLVYDELSLSEIAFQMNYSSVAYLSNQFKKITGLTPSHFKKLGSNHRRSLEEL